jgi:hypothetical protein
MILLACFYHRQPEWPNPEASVGRLCDRKVGGQYLYEAKGQVCRLFNEEIGPAIERLLNDHKEDLERCECRPQHMAVCIRMLGPEPRRTQPVLIIASLGVKQRKKAKNLIQEYRVLANHPKILLKTIGELPAVPKGKRQQPMTVEIATRCESIHIAGSPPTACGAKLTIAPSGQATLGGVITLGGKFYGWTAAHLTRPFNLPLDDETDAGGELAFDADDDSISTSDYSDNGTHWLSSHHYLD